jgi:hypothetical protein
LKIQLQQWRTGIRYAAERRPEDLGAMFNIRVDNLPMMNYKFTLTIAHIPHGIPTGTPLTNLFAEDVIYPHQ